MTDLDIVQGATFRRALLWRQPPTAEQVAAHEPGTPYPLAGCTATAQIRKKVNGQVMLTLYDGDGILLEPNGPGTIVVELTSERTMALELKRAGAWDLFVTFPSGDVLRVTKGAVAVDLAVTDPVEA